jgi:hypothetical protein
MNSPFRCAVAAALPLAVLVGQSFAEDKPDLLKFDTVVVISQTISKNEEGEFGLLHGGILLKDGRPEACFDLVVDKGEKPELVYLILFQSRKLPSNLKISMQSASTPDYSRGKFSLDVAGKPLEISFDFKRDAKAGKVAERTLRLAGRDWKSHGPRVFLADPTGEKLILKPIEVRLPEEIPSPSDADIKNRMRQVIESISKNSVEVRRFLEQE